MKSTLVRVVAVVLLVVGAGLLAASALAWNRGSREVRSWDDALAKHAADLKTTREDLKNEGLRYQAFQKSIPSIPDSLKLTSGGMIRDEGAKHDKATRRLEYQERDIQLDVTRAKRKRAEAEAARKAQTLPFAASGAGAMVVGALGVVVSRSRRKAA